MTRTEPEGCGTLLGVCDDGGFVKQVGRFLFRWIGVPEDHVTAVDVAEAQVRHVLLDWPEAAGDATVVRKMCTTGFSLAANFAIISAQSGAYSIGATGLSCSSWATERASRRSNRCELLIK